MRQKPGKAEYLAWAARARAQAAEATVPTAQAIHLGLAREYEEKAAKAGETAPDQPE